VLSKRQVCRCKYFILSTLKNKKIMDTGVLDFFIKKLILDFYFCLKSSPVFLFQIFIVAPPSPSQGIYNCIINNKLINNKFRFLFKINFIYESTDICSIFNADLSFSRNTFLFFSLNFRSITFI
jgi:hypothetical protein